MISLYGNGKDICMISIGLVASVLFGAGLPAFSFMFGLMMDGVGSKADNHSMKDNTYYMLAVGVFVGIFGML